MAKERKSSEFFSRMPHERHFGEYKTYLFVNEEFNPNGKRILLIGGGTSPILTDLLNLGFCPKSVTNVDPYALPQNDSRQILIKEDFIKYKISYDSYDEIWALFSLPFWLDNIKQTDTFLSKALLGLAPNGNFRIYPVPLEGQGDECLKKMKKFAEYFTKTFPWTQCKFKEYQGANMVVFRLPQSKEGINEWLERKYKSKRNIIEIIREALHLKDRPPK
jgi:hypothetical protein